jgi:hypothetical protein
MPGDAAASARFNGETPQVARPAGFLHTARRTRAMATDDDIAGDVEGEDYGSYPVTVSLIAEDMKIDRTAAEQALRQMVVSGHVRARGHEISETRPSPNSTVGKRVYRQQVRLDFNRGSYSLADIRREIRKAQTPERGGEQQTAGEEAAPAAKKPRGPHLPGWKAGIIARAAYHLDDQGDLGQTELAKFIMDEAAKDDRSIGSTSAQEYAAEIMREHRRWRSRK